MVKKDDKLPDIDPKDYDDLYQDVVFHYTFDPDVEEARIHQELVKTFTGLKGKEKKIANQLAVRLAEVTVNIMIAKAEYRARGLVYAMPQGSYEVRKREPYLEIYSEQLKEFKSLYQQILELYPKDLPDKEQMSGLLQFMKKYQ